MAQELNRKEELLDVLYHGLQDELNAAYQYIALAGRYGTDEVKQSFLHYAQDELRHADKLMGMIRELDETVHHLSVVQEEQDDLFFFLIDYMAKEESAIFYYEALENLVKQPELQLICREIRGEEQMHLHQIRALYQKVKQMDESGF